MVTLGQAKKLIKLAKDSISKYFEGKKIKPSKEIIEEFGEKQGAFVSLYVGKELNGCIGYPEPILPLYKAVIQAAQEAAFADPRFPPLEKEQMKDLCIELSILTKPEVIEVKEPSEYPSKVKIGKDGLMIKDEFGSGLLLPQVAVEWKWNSKKFLEETCRKAGLEPNCWDNMKRNVFKFTAQIFREEKGKIVAKKLY